MPKLVYAPKSIGIKKLAEELTEELKDKYGLTMTIANVMEYFGYTSRQSATGKLRGIEYKWGSRIKRYRTVDVARALAEQAVA